MYHHLQGERGGGEERPSAPALPRVSLLTENLSEVLEEKKMHSSFFFSFLGDKSSAHRFH